MATDLESLRVTIKEMEREIRGDERRGREKGGREEKEVKDKGAQCVQ